jgi:hypothetical protein
MMMAEGEKLLGRVPDLDRNTSPVVPWSGASRLDVDQPCSCSSITRTTPDFTIFACEIRGISLPATLLMFSRGLPQALKEISGLLSASASIRGLFRRGVVAQHMKARAKNDNLDRHFLAEVLIILYDVARIVERGVLEILANQVAAGCMHAKFPGLEPRRGQRFLTEETATRPLEPGRC